MIKKAEVTEEIIAEYVTAAQARALDIGRGGMGKVLKRGAREWYIQLDLETMTWKHGDRRPYRDDDLEYCLWKPLTPAQPVGECLDCIDTWNPEFKNAQGFIVPTLSSNAFLKKFAQSNAAEKIQEQMLDEQEGLNELRNKVIQLKAENASLKKFALNAEKVERKATAQISELTSERNNLIKRLQEDNLEKSFEFEQLRRKCNHLTECNERLSEFVDKLKDNISEL